MSAPISRRQLIGLVGTLSVATGLAAAGGASAAEVCFDPDTLPASQKSLRRSLGFQPQSPDPKKQCASCSFFTAAGSDCGKCVLLSGGPVMPGSLCNSWAAKG